MFEYTVSVNFWQWHQALIIIIYHGLTISWCVVPPLQFITILSCSLVCVSAHWVVYYMIIRISQLSLIGICDVKWLNASLKHQTELCLLYQLVVLNTMQCSVMNNYSMLLRSNIIPTVKTQLCVTPNQLVRLGALNPKMLKKLLPNVWNGVLLH